MERNDDKDRFFEVLRETYKKMLERKARLGEMVHTDAWNRRYAYAKGYFYHRVYGELPAM